MTTQATAPATPPPVRPAPAAPPTTTASIGERMAIKRRTILAKSPPAPAETGSGGDGEPGGVVSAPTTAEPANDNAPAVTEPEKPANDNETPEEKAKAEADKAAEQRRADAKAEREQRRKVIQEAVSLRAEKRKLRQMRTEQEARQREIDAGLAERRELEELKKTDPIAAARRMGLSVKDFLERDLKDEQAKPKVPLEDLPPEVRAEIEESRKFREELARKEKEREEREAKEQTAAKRAHAETEGHRHIAAVFAEEKGDYPHLENYFDADTVVASAWQIIYSHYEETEEELDLRKVLGYMEDNARKEREKFSKPLPPKGVPDRASREASQASNPEPTTMSQSDAASGAPAARKETQAQRRDRIRKRSQSR